MNESELRPERAGCEAAELLLYSGSVGGRLTVVCVDEMRCLRGVVDELDLANLPHLSALVTELLQHAHRRTYTHARQTWLLHRMERAGGSS